jgi:hypothetical protein
VIYFSFLIGVVLLVGYVIYCIIEFIKIDRFSRLPEKKGSLKLKSVKINGQLLSFDSESKEPVIKIKDRIRRMEFGVRFEGRVRNGFFHAIIRYVRGRATHVPESNTYLGDAVFAEGRLLVLSFSDGRLNTGILQGNETIELLFEVCKDLTENPVIGIKDIPRLGRIATRRYCSIPENFEVESIELRVYEDPTFRSNYKRRAVDLITVRPSKLE